MQTTEGGFSVPCTDDLQFGSANIQEHQELDSEIGQRLDHRCHHPGKHLSQVDWEACMLKNNSPDLYSQKVLRPWIYGAASAGIHQTEDEGLNIQQQSSQIGQTVSNQNINGLKIREGTEAILNLKAKEFRMGNKECKQQEDIPRCMHQDSLTQHHQQEILDWTSHSGE